MRHLAVLAVLLGVLPAACSAEGPSNLDTSGVGTTRSDIIGGALDATDRSVLEIFYDTSYPVSACNGNSTCLQGCFDATSGAACTSGSACSCGSGATCTGELIGPHTVVTAGHCTDLTAGGEVSGPERPALTVCSSLSDVMAVAGETPTSNGCNLAIFVLFNNACTTNDTMNTCESRLLTAGNFVIADSVTNPGYDGSVVGPYTATHNDNDIGLLHLASSTLQNGQAEPGILTFNRIDLGASCLDLGSLRFVGYGVTNPSQGSTAISGVKYDVTHDARVKDAWHNEEDGAQTSPLSTCGAGSGEEPTCSGDSGGPSFNSAGVIVGVTSLGDPTCSIYGEDTRIDAYADWIDAKMAAWGDPRNGSSSASDGGGTASQCAADCGVATGKDAGSAADSSVARADGGESGAAGDADTQRGSPDADGATVSAGSGGRSGGGGCSVGATRSGSTGRDAALVSLMLAAAFLTRRTRIARAALFSEEGRTAAAAFRRVALRNRRTALPLRRTLCFDRPMMNLNPGMPTVFAMMVSSTLSGACSKPSTDAAQSNATATAAATATPTPLAAAATPAAQNDPADTPDQTATAAPPPPQAENPGPPPTPADVWASGSWQLEQGRFVWTKGHWEGRHEGQFEQARWVQVNGRWEHHPARWIGGRPEQGRPIERPAEPRPFERPAERPIERR